jgi:hypothetical protein
MLLAVEPSYDLLSKAMLTPLKDPSATWADARGLPPSAKDSVPVAASNTAIIAHTAILFVFICIALHKYFQPRCAAGSRRLRTATKETQYFFLVKIYCTKMLNKYQVSSYFKLFIKIFQKSNFYILLIE